MADNTREVTLDNLLDNHAMIYAKTTMQYITGEITEEERDKEWHHSDLKTKHASDPRLPKQLKQKRNASD